MQACDRPRVRSRSGSSWPSLRGSPRATGQQALSPGHGPRRRWRAGRAAPRRAVAPRAVTRGRRDDGRGGGRSDQQGSVPHEQRRRCGPRSRVVGVPSGVRRRVRLDVEGGRQRGGGLRCGLHRRRGNDGGAAGERGRGCRRGDPGSGGRDSSTHRASPPRPSSTGREPRPPAAPNRRRPRVTGTTHMSCPHGRTIPSVLHGARWLRVHVRLVRRLPCHCQIGDFESRSRPRGPLNGPLRALARWNAPGTAGQSGAPGSFATGPATPDAPAAAPHFRDAHPMAHAPSPGRMKPRIPGDRPADGALAAAAHPIPSGIIRPEER